MNRALPPAGRVPLCVDLDGTLIPVDSLHECLLLLARRAPRALLRLPARLTAGRAAFKAGVIDALDREPGALRRYVAQLPLNAEVLARLRQAREAGRRLVLVTASDRRLAEALAAHLELFDEVLASDGAHNLRGAAKRELLVARYGEQGYDYIGDAAVDRPVFASAREAILVGHDVGLAQRLRRELPQLQQLVTAPPGLGLLWQAMRPHQWIKNLLVFLPLLLAHRLQDTLALTQTLIAFLAFSLCASSVYIQNDLFDLAADRHHPRKRSRPFASGALRAVQGLRAAAVLVLLAIALALAVSPAFAAVLALYLLLSSAYSLYFKTQALLDVSLLAALYTLRIFAGSSATGIEASFWLLAFAVFMFLSLGIVKRYAEFRAKWGTDDSPQDRERGYTPADAPLLLALGCSSGFIAVLVLALYINSPASQRLYQQPQLLWLLCPLMLYWIARVWLITSRGGMHDDPTVFALRDRSSRVIALLGLAILWAAA